MVEDGRAGLLVPPHDAPALAVAIAALKANLRLPAAPAMLALGRLGIAALRRHPDRAFSLAIGQGLLGLTVVNLANVTMLAAFVPFGSRRRSGPGA